MHFPQTTKVLTQASAESNVELSCGKLLLQKRPRVSQCERRFAVGTGNTQFARL